MSQFIFKMPDLGEGTVEAEIIAWHTQPGDSVIEDQIIVEVMTDKAAVEVPAPVTGRVLSISGAPGDKVAVGSPLIVFETQAPAIVTNTATVTGTATAPGTAIARAPATAPVLATTAAEALPAVKSSESPRVKSSPANRRRASEAGIDLAAIAGSGPGGRILTRDLPVRSDSPAASTPLPLVTEVRVIGVRRLIAQRMTEAMRTIPHFAYVEEVDITELESLRLHLNSKLSADESSLTYLPLVLTALIRVLTDYPQCNALYDSEREVLLRHAAVHAGIATQTTEGLKVPVIRDAQSLGIWELAAEIRKVSAAARSGSAKRDELRGSTITVTSLGKLGGIASTPIINSPEVAIIGLNKAVDRPVVHQGVVVVRRMMNLSSSFDHRFVDGYDAAAMIQSLKERLEHPATLFIN